MVLKVTSATVVFGRTVAVDRVDLELEGGQVLALLGPSGCGKSTLLRAIAGLEPLQSGQISFHGVDLAAIPVHRRGFGLMFQDGVLFPHRTVAGNIAYGLEAERRPRMSKAAAGAKVASLLELVGLPGYASRKVASLSGGEQQRVALARALAPEPELLLLDEPLAALDASLRERLLMDLRGILRATRTTAVFVTHDQAEAFAIGDVVAVMNDGRIQQQGALRQVWGSPASAWVAQFVGYTSVIPHPDDSEPAPHARCRMLALRPAALVVDPAGEISGSVTGISPRPESLLITMDVDGWGSVSAVGPSDVEPAIGEVMRVRLNRRYTATVPAAGPITSAAARG